MLICGSEPTGADCFPSGNVQIIHNHRDRSWRDATAHAHGRSDEIYIVLQGTMTIEVEGEPVPVAAGEYLCIGAGTRHRVLGAEVPHRSFIVRGPSVRDKIGAW